MTEPSEPLDEETEDREPAGAPDVRGASFWVAYGVGTAVMAWGVWLFVQATSPDELVGLGLWVVLSDLLVDWIAVPVVLLAGWLVVRLLPAWARAPAQVALMTTGAVLVVGWLPLVGTAPADNPTIQPLDYPRLVGTTLLVLWLGAATWAAWRRWRSRA
jgi:hypothetical protein